MQYPTSIFPRPSLVLHSVFFPSSMLFPVTYIHPADCVLLTHPPHSFELSSLPPPSFHMLLPASILNAACYLHPTSYSHSVYCILTQPSTFYFHPSSHFPLPSSTLLWFPDFILHVASFYILPFLDAASYFHPSCCFPRCFSFFILHIASFYLLQSCRASCFHPPSCSHLHPTHFFLLPTSTLHPASFSQPPRCFQLAASILQAASS